MPFIPADLKIALEKFWDQESPNFVESPPTKLAAAEAWADALDVYGINVIPISVGASAGRIAFINTFLTMTEIPPTGAAIFPLCFVNYAIPIAAGMLPAFVGTPPPSPPNFAPVIAAGTGGASNAVCLDLMVIVIDTWMRTGTAVPSGGGSTINWS